MFKNIDGDGVSAGDGTVTVTADVVDDDDSIEFCSCFSQIISLVMITPAFLVIVTTT